MEEEHSSEDTWKLVAPVRKLPTLSEADMPTAPAAQQTDPAAQEVSGHPPAQPETGHHHK